MRANNDSRQLTFADLIESQISELCAFDFDPETVFFRPEAEVYREQLRSLARTFSTGKN